MLNFKGIGSISNILINISPEVILGFQYLLAMMNSILATKSKSQLHDSREKSHSQGSTNITSDIFLIEMRIFKKGSLFDFSSDGNTSYRLVSLILQSNHIVYERVTGLIKISVSCKGC